MKVWLVSRGEYSDFIVLGIYSTKELADEATKRFGATNDPEEYELDGMPALPDGLYGWRILFVGEEIRNIRREDLSDFARRGKAWGHVTYLGRTNYVDIYCLAKDEEHAKRIGIEQRPVLITECEQRRKAGLDTSFVTLEPSLSSLPTASPELP